MNEQKILRLSQGPAAQMMTQYHGRESHSEPADVNFCVGGCLSLYACDEVVNCVGQNLLQLLPSENKEGWVDLHCPEIF